MRIVPPNAAPARSTEALFCVRFGRAAGLVVAVATACALACDPRPAGAPVSPGAGGPPPASATSTPPARVAPPTATDGSAASDPDDATPTRSGPRDTGGGGAVQQDTLEDLVEDERRRARAVRWRPPPPERRTAYERLVSALVRRAADGTDGAPPAAPPGEAWDALGLEVVALPAARGGVWVVREIGDSRRGAALLVLRWGAKPDGQGPLVVQVPHSFYDRGTADLGLALFRRSGARALQINTVHRYGGRKRDAAPDAPDVAHREDTLFHAATRGLCSALGEATFVQIHGFARGGHGELGEADIVVSAGTRTGLADPRIAACVARLGRALRAGAAVAYDGRVVRTLGGTRNVQGRFVNAYTDDRFYHLELSDRLRDQLSASPGLRTRTLDALESLATP